MMVVVDVENKKRLTVAFIVNSTGTVKKKPLIINNAETPHAIRNTNTKSFFSWFSNNNGWMTKQIFLDYLIQWDAELKEKVLLIVDNFSGHNIDTSLLENIQLVFLPPNSAGVTQPLDLGIINSFKNIYKKKIVEFYLHSYIKK